MLLRSLKPQRHARLLCHRVGLPNVAAAGVRPSLSQASSHSHEPLVAFRSFHAAPAVRAAEIEVDPPTADAPEEPQSEQKEKPRPALAAGDFVEVRRGGKVFHGILAQTPEFATFTADHRTILYNGHYILHRADDVTYQIPGWAFSERVSQPLSSDFATAGLSNECAQILSKADIPAHAVAHIEKFREAADSYAFDRRHDLSKAYEYFLKEDGAAVVTVDKVARWVFCRSEPGSNPTPAESFATYQSLIKNCNAFEPCSTARMRTHGEFMLRSPREAEDISWVLPQVRAAARQNVPKATSKEPVLNVFMEKVKKLVEAHRKCHHGLPKGVTDGSGQPIQFTEREQIFIRSIKAAAYHSSVFPSPHRQIATSVLKGLYPLYGNRPGQTEALQLLKEIGVLTPWENVSMFKSTLKGRMTGLEGHGMSAWADKVAQDAQTMGKELLAGNEFTFDDSGTFKPVPREGDAPARAAHDGYSAQVQEMLVFPTTAGPEQSFYERDPCAEIRRDFGQLPVYVIDEPTAHELDDGMSVEQRADGLWVHVHIADPTAYIPPGHPLSLSAQIRANSVYLPERHYPMMPDFLSNERFNLGKSQCAMTFSARIGEDGEFLDVEVTSSIVRNVKIIHYDDVDDVLDWSRIHGVAQKPEDRSPWIARVLEAKNVTAGVKSDTMPGVDAEGVQQLRLLQQTMQRATAARLRNGAFVPDQLATRVTVNPYPQPFTPAVNPAGPYFPPRDTWPAITLSADWSGHLSPSHTMVSECMVMAGRVAAKWCHDRQVPAIYRGQPTILDTAKVENRDHAAAVEALRIAREAQDPVSGVVPLQQFAKLLAYMPSAVVDTTPIGHFSMGIPGAESSAGSSAMAGYVKVTSPLRRYKDMIVHWNMKAYMLAEKAAAGGRAVSPAFPFEKSSVAKISTRLRDMEKRTNVLNTRTDRHWVSEWLRRREILVRRSAGAGDASAGSALNVSAPMPYVDFRDTIDDKFLKPTCVGGVGPTYTALVTRVDAAAASGAGASVVLTELGGVSARIQPTYGAGSGGSGGLENLKQGDVVKVAMQRIDVARGAVDVVIAA
ncbi:hypothetical protein HDU87_002793 [Geranomyces variabilis]|uniref:RNB domain-containing protein n=1 Tax=Geranomyces variabilis TaxID=109894 RepID=A0AAD5TN49_9FUNG|nr:hypothetical protein HDU87_002793 [Geranomyces variabilis]